MISVVIPLYNKEKSIITTLKSVLAQTYTDWELIIVDDGSTDRSADIVREFFSTLQIEDFKFQIISQKNAGVSAARNTGILAAKGEYVAFLDGDDLWDKDLLKEMVRLIEEYPRKSIYGLGCEKIIGDNPTKREDIDCYRGETYWEWNSMAYTGSSSCVRKQDAISVGLFDTRMTHGEDIDMWWRLLLKNGGACYAKPYAYYRQDAENRAMHRVVPLERFLPYYIDKFEDARKKNSDFRKFFDREMVYRIYPYLFDKRYREEARYLARKLDYKGLKFSLHFRLLCPHLYRLFTGR